jgi:LmbE family N-acetylglucosaminyl deacetylase
MTFTLVAFHAHPDDEALLTAGTLARAAAEGHRTVLVVATLGEAGLTRPGVPADELGETRRAELAASAAALGVARVEVLGFADSGMHGEAGGMAAFCRADVGAAAERLASLLREEAADVLTVYDDAGGYGHPDHVQVARVGVLAAKLADTPVVLAATVHRRALQRVLRVLRYLPGIPPDFAPERFARAFVEPASLTHAVDVRGYANAKRASMRAHVSQTQSSGDRRTLAVLLRLPRPLFRRALGREWYVEAGRHPGVPLLDDVFASVRQ